MGAAPWYSAQGQRSQCHDTTTIEVMYHFFCFALLNTGRGIHQFHMDNDDYMDDAHELSYGHMRGNIFKEAAKRTKALGLFLDNNSSFLFQDKAGLYRVRMLSSRAITQVRQECLEQEDAREAVIRARAVDTDVDIYMGEPLPSPMSSVLNGTGELDSDSDNDSWETASDQDSQGNSKCISSRDHNPGDDPEED